jgi:murein DD-endopeptidase MepM/ murein hydrolase activator NlpD
VKNHFCSARPQGGLFKRLLPGIVALLLLTPLPALAQAAPCGVVDAIDYPVDIADTLADDFDDFGRFRQRFGGLHVGIDLAFHRQGEPVRAAARGRVTYSDPAGWDTEKGVVIIEHIFPDASVVYSLYGHVEENDQFRLPLEGACVERGQIIGSVGDPSLSAPHLHYEIRDFLPDDGGPGYVSTNPLRQGWHHPLDFTERWRLRLLPGFVGAVSLDAVPALPPVVLESGIVVSAHDGGVAAYAAPDEMLWRITTDDAVTGLAALPGDRVVAHSESGQVMVLQQGRYLALWQIADLAAPLVTLGERLIFATRDGGLAAFDPTGAPLWTLPGGDPIDAVYHFEAHENTVGIGIRRGGQFRWRSVTADGALLYEAALAPNPLVAANPAGGWLLLEGASLDRIVGGDRWTIGTTGQIAGRGARLTVDLLGSSYIFLGDAESTLLSVGAAGEPRWRVNLPYRVEQPLLDTGNGCLLYVLAADGVLSMFSTGSGALINQVSLYAGGSRTSSPAARLLAVDQWDRLLVGAGFLSVVQLDGVALNPTVAANCWLG